MRILITEEALESGTGHWPNYIGSLASDLRELGDEVDVLTHRQATSQVLARVGGTAWYSRNCWTDVKSQGKLGGVRHNWSFYTETMRWLRENGPYDRILALTMRMQHLLAYAAMSRSRKLQEESRFVLLFVQGFGRYVEPGKETVFPPGFSTKMARAAFRVMAPAVMKGRVVLAGETIGMCDELQRFTGLPTTLYPHPVKAYEDRKNSGPALAGFTEPQRSGSDLKFPDVLKVTCPGYARYEKGSDLLAEAILQILEMPLGNRVHFVLQWPEPFTLPDGRSLSPDERLLSDPRVEFLNENLGPAAYADLLESSDLVILPYRSEAYHQRLSRVAIEAAREGIPLVYSIHTWTEEIAELVGCGVSIHEETPEGIVAALQKAIEQYSELKKAALDGAGRVRAFHTAESFRERFA